MEMEMVIKNIPQVNKQGVYEFYMLHVHVQCCSMMTLLRASKGRSEVDTFIQVFIKLVLLSCHGNNSSISNIDSPDHAFSAKEQFHDLNYRPHIADNIFRLYKEECFSHITECYEHISRIGSLVTVITGSSNSRMQLHVFDMELSIWLAMLMLSWSCWSAGSIRSDW